MYSTSQASSWTLDAKWDPCGNGVLSASADSPTVLMQYLWTTSKSEVADFRRKTYQHATSDASIWSMNLFVSEYTIQRNGEDDTLLVPKVATAATDGTVYICHIPSCQLTRVADNTTTVAQLFRLHRVINDPTELSTASASSSTRGSPIVFFSSTKKHIPYLDKPEIRIPLPSVALRTVSSCEALTVPEIPSALINRRSRPLIESRMFAYGGAVGLIRVHSIVMPWVDVIPPPE